MIAVFLLGVFVGVGLTGLVLLVDVLAGRRRPPDVETMLHRLYERAAAPPRDDAVERLRGRQPW